jgi:hypothetical protein
MADSGPAPVGAKKETRKSSVKSPWDVVIQVALN